MSTLAEIEEAVEQLPSRQQEELLRFLAERLRVRAAQGADVADLERRNGFAVFAERAGRRATPETVRRLCAEEGV